MLATQSQSKLEFVPITRLHPSDRRPRRALDAGRIESLAASISATGILQPLLVQVDPQQPDHYRVVAGARRLWAARRLAESDDPAARERCSMLPCLVREANDDRAFADALAENLVREDLTRRELMDAIKALKDTYGWSVRAIARHLGRSDHDLSELLRVVSDPEVSALVADDLITPTAAGLLVQSSAAEVRQEVIDAVRRGTVRTVAQMEVALAQARRCRRASTDPPPLRGSGDAAQLSYQLDEHGRVLGLAPDAPCAEQSRAPECDADAPHVQRMLGGLTDDAACIVESALRYGAEKGWSCADLLRALQSSRVPSQARRRNAWGREDGS